MCFGLSLEVFLDGQISSYMVKVADCRKFESLCQTFERVLNLSEIQTEERHLNDRTLLDC